MEIIAAVVVGAALGGAAAWFIRHPQGDSATQALNADLQSRLASEQAAVAAERAARSAAEQQAAAARAAATAAREEKERLEARHREDLAAADRRRAEDLQTLKDTFAKQSTEALRAVAPDMSKQVKALVDPLMTEIRASLEGVNSSVGKQGDALAGVRERMENLSKVTEALATETNDFTMVLKSASHRGRWGEQTLRRVVEAAGMSPHCDFAEQLSQDDKRPDLVVKLPGGRCVIIDSKVPELDAARLAPGTANRAEILRDHAVKLRQTIKSLAGKDYPSTIGSEQGLVAFDKVILFLPAESLLSTALESDNDLVIDAGKQGILLATPATLIGFLGAISLTWQQHAQVEKVREIAALSTDLYKRVCDFAEHLADARKHVNQAVGSLNQSFGSFEKNVRPLTTQLSKLGINPTKELPGEAELGPVGEMRDLKRKDS